MLDRSVVFALVTISLLTACQAEVAYDPARRVVRVTGFTEERPGTLQDVADADARGRWGVIALDNASQTATLNAGLEIGADDGSSTWFRIGTSERPKETLVIRGDLRVRSPQPAGGYLQFNGCNTLWIGDRNDRALAPTVRFNCGKKDEFGLLVEEGCALDLEHALISVVKQDRRHTARCMMKCRQVRIVDSTLEWIGGPSMTYGIASALGTVQGVVFQHGGVAFGNGNQWLRDCTFRDLDIAVRDSGALNATFLNCRFEDNRCNWRLNCSNFGIVAVDCFFGAETDPGPAARRWKNPETGRWQHPSFIAERHLVVKVQEENGNPIRGALVRLTESKGDLSAVHHGIARTGADGRTPQPAEYGALLATDYAYKATDDVPAPDSRDCRVAVYDYRYTLHVTAEGYREAVVKDLDLDQSWVEKTVVLKRG